MISLIVGVSAGLESLLDVFVRYLTLSPLSDTAIRTIIRRRSGHQLQAILGKPARSYM